MSIMKREKSGRQDILKLGKDTDMHTCRKLGGKEVEGVCVVVEAGRDDQGDIILKRLSSAEETSRS